MKEITTNGKTLLFIEVPEDAKDFRISYLQGDPDLIYKDGNGFRFVCTLLYRDLQILGKSTELSEDQMNEMCDTANLYTLGFPITSEKVYKDYFKTNSSFSTVQESYLSLLEANGIDNNKHYLVLEKI